jgi:hypothetical protein
VCFGSDDLEGLDRRGVFFRFSLALLHVSMCLFYTDTHLHSIATVGVTTFSSVMI